MKHYLYIILALGLLLQTSCNDDGLSDHKSMQVDVLCKPMQNGRQVTRAVFETAPTPDYPDEITVVPSEGTTFVIKKGGSVDNTGYTAYHITNNGITDQQVAGKTFTAYAPNRWSMLPNVSGVEYLSGSGTYDWDRAHLFFTLEHSQAMLRFHFRITAQYDKVRQIVVRELKVNDIAAQLRDPASNLLALNDKCDAVCYVNPTSITVGSTQLALSCTYDVYAKDDPALEYPVRQGVTAGNTLTIGKSGSDITSIQKGYYYDFNILLDPEFLYTLSDHDEPIDLILR